MQRQFHYNFFLICEEGWLQLGMWCRHREAYSMYKRLSSRDYMNTTDVKTKEFIDTVDMEDNSGNSIMDI